MRQSVLASGFLPPGRQFCQSHSRTLRITSTSSPFVKRSCTCGSCRQQRDASVCVSKGKSDSCYRLAWGERRRRRRRRGRQSLLAA